MVICNSFAIVPPLSTLRVSAMLENIVSIRDWNDVTTRVSFASMEESAMMHTRKSDTCIVSIVLH
jgi:hypothetical protein